MKLNQKLLWTVLISSSFTVQAQNLLETYQLAVANDPVVKQAFSNTQATKEIRDQSIAQMLPTISADASSGRSRLNNSKQTFQGTGAQEYWEHKFGLYLSQPVFHWDHWVQLEQSDNQIAQANALYDAEEQNLMLRTTEAYFDVLSAQDTLEFTVAEKEAIAKQLDQAQQRFEVGLIAITDVHEAKASYDQVRADEIVAMNEIDNSKERLREIIGDYEAELSILAEKLPLIKPVPEDINAWVENAKNQNLNIIADFNQTEVARKTIELQRSGHYPQVDIVGSFSQQDIGSNFGLRGDTQNIGVQFNIPLFEGGGVSSRTRQAEYQHQQSQQKLEETQRAVIRATKNSYRGVVSSIYQVEALKAAVISTESGLEATEAGFEVGTRTMVDVLTVQRNLYDAKRNYSRSRYDYLINGIRLKNATSILTQEDLTAINRLLN